jgi:hypothetical protein
MTAKQQSLVTTPAPAEKPADKSAQTAPVVAPERAMTPAERAQAALARKDLIERNQGALIDRAKVGDLEGALKAAHQDLPAADAAKLLVDTIGVLANRNTIRLNDAHAFKRLGGNGEVVAVQRRVKLTIDKGELYRIPLSKEKNEQGKWVSKVDTTTANITHPGYMALNAAAGVFIEQPMRLELNGEVVSNPYVRRNADGEIEATVIGMYGYGRTPTTGQPFRVFYLLEIPATAGLVARLAKEAEYAKDSTNPPVYWEDKAAKVPPGHKFFKVEKMGGIGLMANLRHAAVIKILAAATTGAEFDTRKLATVCERNLLRRCPSIGITKVQTNARGEAFVDVTCWVPSHEVQEAYAGAEAALLGGANISSQVSVESLRMLAASGDQKMPLLEQQHDIINHETIDETMGGHAPDDAEEAEHLREDTAEEQIEEHGGEG